MYNYGNPILRQRDYMMVVIGMTASSCANVNTSAQPPPAIVGMK